MRYGRGSALSFFTGRGLSEPKEPQHRQNDDDQADNIDETVHYVAPSCTSLNASRMRLFQERGRSVSRLSGGIICRTDRLRALVGEAESGLLPPRRGTARRG